MVRLSALGDVVLTTGVLDYWHRQYGWRFTVVTKDAFVPIFANHPAVDEVIGLRKEELRVPAIVVRARDLAARFSGWGLLDLHGTFKTRLLSLFWKGPVLRYAKKSLERRVYLWSQKRLFGQALVKHNVTQRYALAYAKTPPSRAELRPRLFLTAKEQEQAQLHLARVRLAGQKETSLPLVVLHPYATHPNKAWNEASWRQLMYLLDTQGIPWIVVGQGTPMAGLPVDRDFTNQTSLRETCALLNAATVLVTGDSGPMHLACAVGTPVVGLFGPTSRAWGFYPEGREDVVVEMDIACRPCTLHGKTRCGNQRVCMNAITPEYVFETLMERFGSRHSKTSTIPSRS